MQGCLFQVQNSLMRSNPASEDKSPPSKFILNYVNVYDTYEMETDKGICFKLEDIDDWGSYICI